MEDLKSKLLDKSKEAFALAIEIYNKPTIKYRVEGFAMFICNAWELMLKAHMLSKFGEKSIYYKDHPERTLSLESCIKNVFTNSKDPLRLNLEKIIELRNTSTHFITEEYEMVYIPLFQACIFNYNEKMMSFHQIDMTSIIPQNFLTLSVSMKALTESEIIAKYPEEIAQKVLCLKDGVDDLSVHNNDRFSIRIDHYHYLTKNKDKATSFVGITKDANANVKIMKELKDPNNTHNYTAKSCIEKIQQRIIKENIPLRYNREPARFTSFHFNNFCKYFGLKTNEKFCYIHKQFTQPQYSYSQQLIDFIIEEIQKDPECILDNIKKS
ncbi:DUF3644 domain-containing protein [Eubacterium callanderi]|uniref:DUF3644 domain-containing protein n=1 Tax=Eubacterium callanderi TaxID=53442 RepID=UPI001D13D106|nr:DUF3644 domain-containing protein [Eubacterium callanderi]MCC3401067.1 DUF3644 domain-containing protein [Eubacterium callanderi]